MYAWIFYCWILEIIIIAILIIYIFYLYTRSISYEKGFIYSGYINYNITNMFVFLILFVHFSYLRNCWLWCTIYGCLICIFSIYCLNLVFLDYICVVVFFNIVLFCVFKIIDLFYLSIFGMCLLSIVYILALNICHITDVYYLIVVYNFGCTLWSFLSCLFCNGLLLSTSKTKYIGVFNSNELKHFPFFFDYYYEPAI